MQKNIEGKKYDTQSSERMLVNVRKGAKAWSWSNLYRTVTGEWFEATINPMTGQEVKIIPLGTERNARDWCSQWCTPEQCLYLFGSLMP